MIARDPTESNVETPDHCVGVTSAAPAGALTDVEFWNIQQTAALSEHDSSLRPRWYGQLSCFLPKSQETTFLEVGVVPGHVMLFFARTLRYRCTGVDFSPQIRYLPPFFSRLGVEGRFIETDFFSWANDEQFDIVYSNGFIEHFINYEMVILKHWDKVASGGLMILAVPTFKTPVQWWMRHVFYEPWLLQEVLRSHNLDIMNLDALKDCVLKMCRDAKVLQAIWEPGMPLWFRNNMKGIRKGLGRKLLWVLMKVCDRILFTCGISCHWCAGVAVVIVKKADPSR